jgi:hypothetical protein
VSGQKTANVRNVNVHASVGELIHSLVARLGLPPNDPGGEPLTYQILSEREARHLNASELVGDALQQDDVVVLQPNLQAGGDG